MGVASEGTLCGVSAIVCHSEVYQGSFGCDAGDAVPGSAAGVAAVAGSWT